MVRLTGTIALHQSPKKDNRNLRPAMDLFAPAEAPNSAKRQLSVPALDAFSRLESVLHRFF
jgi:hypothetical protein